VTRKELASKLAQALTSTSDRYLAGCMSRPTWSSHISSLWGQVDAAGLKKDVLKLVDPAKVGLRPLSEQRI